MVRIKHRYLLLNILYPDMSPAAGAFNRSVPYAVQFNQPSPEQLNSKIILRMIRDGVAELFGDFGAGKVSPSLQVKYFSQSTSTAIIRVSRDYYRLVWAALTYVVRLPAPMNRPCVIQVVRVSGTIKKSEEEAIRRARTAIRRAQRPINSTIPIDPFATRSTLATSHLPDAEPTNLSQPLEHDGG